LQPEGWSSSVQQDQARAEDLLLEALERDANRSDAHATMGFLRRLQNRLAESRIQWETSIALDRNNATAIRNLGITLMYLGQPEAAILQIDKGMRRSPYDYTIPVANWSSGLSYLLLGRVDEGIPLS
jgi:adenylate cyclase